MLRHEVQGGNHWHFIQNSHRYRRWNISQEQVSSNTWKFYFQNLISIINFSYHIAISTDDRVYIFDMICLAERHIKEVKKELTAILYSRCITKIVHDMQSTCAKLIEVHQLEMTPTFDLMTAAASQDWPKEIVKQFDSLLINLLAIDKRNVMFQLPTADELAINAAFLLPMQQKLTSAWYVQLFKNMDTSKQQFLDPKSDENHLETFQNNLTHLTNKIQNINV